MNHVMDTIHLVKAAEQRTPDCRLVVTDTNLRRVHAEHSATRAQIAAIVAPDKVAADFNVTDFIG